MQVSMRNDVRNITEYIRTHGKKISDWFEMVQQIAGHPDHTQWGMCRQGCWQVPSEMTQGGGVSVYSWVSTSVS